VVGDSKNVIIFDPLLTGHVIWRMVIGRVRIFNGIAVNACSILSRSVGKKTGSRNMADFQHIKCKINGNHPYFVEMSHSKRNLGRIIEWWCLNLHRKFKITVSAHAQ